MYPDPKSHGKKVRTPMYPDPKSQDTHVSGSAFWVSVNCHWLQQMQQMGPDTFSFLYIHQSLSKTNNICPGFKSWQKIRLYPVKIQL